MNRTLSVGLLCASVLAPALFVGCARGGERFADTIVFSIEVTPTNPSIALGTSEGFTATAIYRSGRTRDLTSSVSWSSSNAAAATLSGGVATGVGLGATTIRATDPESGVHGETTLSVSAAELVSIEVTPTNPIIALGTQQAFVATGSFTDGTTQDLSSTVVWSSSSPSVATLAQNLASGVALGASAIRATDPGTGIHGETTLTVSAAVLVSLEVAPANPVIALGTTQLFSATGTYSDGSTQDLTSPVTWSSSNAAAASVSNAPGSHGLATGTGLGSTTITATDPASGISGWTTLSVSAAELVSIEVTPAHPSIALGTSQVFAATGSYSDGSTQDLSTAVTWSSSSSATATVSNASGSQGLATSVAIGSTTITATDPSSGIHGETTLSVTAAVLVSIEVTPTDPTIALGTTQLFSATGTYSDGSTQDLTSPVTWSSSNSATATISNASGSHGLATSVAVGTTTIRATDPASGISGNTLLSVSAAVLVSIGVTPANPSIALGTTQLFAATGTFSDGSTQDLSTAVTWSSSSSATASVSNASGSEGLATSVSVGSTTITATDSASGIHGDALLSVTAAVLVSIDVAPANPSIALGTTQLFAATGTYSDGSTQDLTSPVAWSSSNGAAATISNAPGSHGLATSVAIGSTTITATDPASGISGNTTLSVTAAVLVSIEVTPTNPSIALGTAQSFTATGTFSDGSTQDLTTTATWSSSNPAAATVSNTLASEGLATSVGPGTTTISALDVASGIAGSTTLSVTAAALVSIDVTPPNPSIALGTSQLFAATGTYSDGSTQDLTSSATWSSSNGAIASVSNASGSHGLATSLAAGSTTITATDPASGIGGNTTLTVSAAVLVSLEVAPTNPAIALGTTQLFAATGIFSDGSTQDLTSSATWSSSSPAIASVSNASGSEGLATSLAVGSTTITATDPASGIHGDTTLSVSAAVLVSIDVTPTNPTIALGTTQGFTATGTFSDGSTQDLTSSATWSSSNTAIASVSNALGSHGLATSVAAGSTTITALDPASGISGGTTLTVSAAVLVSIALAPANPTIALGTTQLFAATGTYSDGSTQDLTLSVGWSSSSPATASVSNASGSEGLATSISVGSTTITATDPSSGIHGDTTLSVSAAVLVSIDVAPADPSIALGTTQLFVATGTYSDSSTQNLSSAVTWSSSSPAIATISNASGTHGLATSVSVGSTTISATEPSSGIAGSTTLGVTAAVLVSIDVAPADPAIALGETQLFSATGSYSDGSTQDLTLSVTWSSSNTAVATASNAFGSHGLATSVSVGSTTIRATDPASGIFGETTLTVTPPVLVSIAVAPANPSILLGATQAFTASGTYSDGSTQDLTTSVSWSSSNTAAATISNAPGSEGLATSVAGGSSAIRATDPGTGVHGETTLTVTADIALVGAASSGAGSGVLSLTVSTPAGTVAGDVMIASIAVRPNTATITAPAAGWTLVRRVNNTTSPGSSLAIYRRVAIAGEPGSHTWTFSASTGSAGCIASFSAVDTTNPIDVENGQNTPSSLTHSTPSVTTTTANTMLVSSHAFTSSATWTPPAGMQEQVDVASETVPNATGIALEQNRVLQPAAGATGVKSAVASGDADAGNTHILALRRAP